MDFVLQEFKIEIKDRSGAEDCVADNLSRLVHEQESIPLDEFFPDEHLYATCIGAPW